MNKYVLLHFISLQSLIKCKNIGAISYHSHCSYWILLSKYVKYGQKCQICIFLCVIFKQVASIFHLGGEKIKRKFFPAFLLHRPSHLLITKTNQLSQYFLRSVWQLVSPLIMIHRQCKVDSHTHRSTAVSGEICVIITRSNYGGFKNMLGSWGEGP